jgi:hypothetical protein
MSKYKTIATQFKTLSSLLAALNDLGYTEDQVQVASDPKVATLGLYGYHNDLRPEKACVRIPRKHITSVSNDIGFFWNGSTYEAIISEFDMTASGPHVLNVERQAQLKQRYALHETKRIAHTKGYTIQETTLADGTIRLAVTHR